MEPKVTVLWVLGNIYKSPGDLKNVLLELATCPEFCGWIRSFWRSCAVWFFYLLVCSKKKQVSY